MGRLSDELWFSRKRQDGRPYDPGNKPWLAEWALNGSIPLPGGTTAVESTRPVAPWVEETRRMLAEKEKTLKAAVPPPEAVRAKLRGLAGHAPAGCRRTFLHFRHSYLIKA